MNRTLAAAALLACAWTCAFAQPTEVARPVGPMLERAQAKAAKDCETARAALAKGPDDDGGHKLMSRTTCECYPQALAAAFPPARRSAKLTPQAFFARVVAPLRVCVARLTREAADVRCRQGHDLVGQVTDPAQVASRCACVRKEISRVADADMGKAADDAWRLDVQEASNPFDFMKQATQVCSAPAGASH